MAYPSSIDSFPGTATQGTSLLTSPDHAADHRLIGSAVGSVEGVLGTTNGTSVLKNFAAGDFAARINSSNVLQQNLQGTINTSVLGSPSITGGTLAGQIQNNGTVANGVYGTATITGGTISGVVANSGTINNGVYGTPSITRIGSISGNDLRLDADTAGSKVTTLTVARQGGTATDWSTAGTANFFVSNCLIQAGVISLPDTGSHAVTYPVAFSKTPILVDGLHNYANAGIQGWVIIANSTTGFTAVAGATGNGTTTLNWVAIGER